MIYNAVGVEKSFLRQPSLKGYGSTPSLDSLFRPGMQYLVFAKFISKLNIIERAK